MTEVKVTKDRYTTDSLYQYDYNQELTIYGLSLPSTPEIHFANSAVKEAIVKKSKMDEAGVVSVDIPNEILTYPHDIDVYVCIYEGDAFRVLYKFTIPVNAKKKPTDYIASDDEKIYSYNALENKIDITLKLALERYDDVNEKYEDVNKKYNEALGTIEDAVNETTDLKKSAEKSAENAEKSAETAKNVLEEAKEKLSLAEDRYTQSDLALLDAMDQYGFATTAYNNANKALDNATNEYEKAIEEYEKVSEDISDYKDQTSENTTDIDNLSVFVTPQMYGAKADGTTDDTVAIQNALNNSSFVYIPDGTYMINAVSGGIKPKNNQTIILSNNATLKAITNASKSYSIVKFEAVNNVYISGGKILGDNATHDTTSGGDSGFGIFVDHSSHITIENMEIADCWGDCIMIGYKVVDNGNGTYSGIQSEDISIYNCKLHGGRRQGISICSGINVVIRDCEIYDITQTLPKSGIDIEPDWVGVAENILIENCYIHDTASASIIVAGNIDGNTTATKDNIKIVGCMVDGINFQPGLTTNVSVSDTTFDTLYFAVKDFIRVDNCKGRKVAIACGNGIFNNCVFENNTTIIGSVTDNKANVEDNDRVSFFNCRFETKNTSATTNFLNFASQATSDTVNVERVIELVNCTIVLDGNTHFSNRMPGKELRVIGCNVRFAKSPTSMKLFCLNQKEDVKLTVHNSTFTYVGTENARHFAIINGGLTIAINIEVDFAYNVFHRTKHFIGSTTTYDKGNVRLLNNTMSVEDVNVNGSGTFTFKGSNVILSESEIISKMLDNLPKYTGGVS